MAGFNVSGLPYFIQYQGQLQEQQRAQEQLAMQRQTAMIQGQQYAQQLQDRQRAQAAQTAAGNALPQLLQGGQVAAQPQQGQMPPPPQPPAPGQASQPMQPPQGAPMPNMGPAPGGVRPPLPPGGVQGQGQPQQLPPFRPMPTTPPQSAAPQGAIPAPPAQAAASGAQQGQGGPLTLQSAIKVLQDQGLSGADLFAGLQQLSPILDTQAKAQAAAAQQQFTQQVQLARLKETADYHRALASSRDVSAEERARHNQALEGIQATLLPLRVQAAQAKLQADPEAKLAPDDLHFMAKQYLAAPDPSIFTNLGRGKQGAANVVGLRKAIKEEAQSAGLSPSDVAALAIGTQGEKAFARATGTRTAAIETAAAEFQQVSPIVRQASAGLPRTQVIPINEALQSAQTGTGDPRWVKLGQAIDTAINVYARAISPTGTPTEGSRQEARKHFKASMTPDQIEAVLGVMDQEVAAARRAPAEVKASQKARLSGKPEGGAAPAIPQGWSVTEH